MRKVEERFDKSVDWSRRYSPFDEVEKEQYPTPRLIEFYYDDPRAEELATAARKKLILAISNFLDNREISALWRSVIAGEHWVEKRLSKLPKVDGFGIEGKIDLLGRADSGVKVVDWKLGQAGGGHDSLQLHLYGLWAGKEFQVEPGRVNVQRVFLGDATVEQAVPLDRSSLRLGKARLIQDIELMKEMEPYGSSGNEEAFSPCVKENVCRQCKYQQVCPDSQSGFAPRPTFVSLPLVRATSDVPTGSGRLRGLVQRSALRDLRDAAREGRRHRHSIEIARQGTFRAGQQCPRFSAHPTG